MRENPGKTGVFFLHATSCALVASVRPRHWDRHGAGEVVLADAEIVLFGGVAVVAEPRVENMVGEVVLQIGATGSPQVLEEFRPGLQARAEDEAGEMGP